MTKKFFLGIVSCVFLLSGCSQNLPFLLRVNSEDQALKQQLKVQEQKFEELLKDIKEGVLKSGIPKKSIIARYAEPILEIPDTATNQTKLLYRHPTDYFGSSKAYLYFDSQQKLLRWELIEH